MWKDFKAFAFQGNVLDLAVAVVIGAAFGKIVSSLVDNIMMPLLEVLLNGISFIGLVWQVGKVEITYGVFLQSILDFFIISLSIFFFIRYVLRKKKEVTEKTEEVDPQVALLSEIRDLLKNKGK